MNRKYKISTIILVILLLFLTMGYAYLSASLNINGTSSIHNATWNIYWDNVVVTDGSVTAETPVIDTNKMTVTYHVTLSKPGDFYEFTVDAVNDGSIDAMIDTISSQLNEVEITELPVYLEYSLSYSDDTEIGVHQLLKSNTTETYKVRIAYKKDITSSDLPETDQELNLSFSVTYVQANTTASVVPHPGPVIDVITPSAVIDDETSAYVTDPNGIQFDSPSSDTNGKGIYVHKGTENDTYPIVYYRGDVPNNNILFGGFCWKILRTTSTGGTKLVYNGVPNSGTCDNTGDATLIASSVKWSQSGNLSYFGYAYQAGHAYKYIKISNIPTNAVFAEDVSYENGKYILNNQRYVKDDSLEENVVSELSTHHYSCFKTAEEDCTKINYIYMTRGGYLYYIILENGETINTAITNDLLNSLNTTNSNIKTTIETWYENNLTEYTDYLEDTVWCNDRTIGSYGAWDKHGSLDDKLMFGSLIRTMNGTPDLNCPNPNDRFTVSTANGNGLSRYPIGLITLDEAMLAGFAWSIDDSSSYLYNGKVWWTMSPSLISVQLDYIGVLHSMADNVTTVYVTGGAGGVRPVVSLNHSVIIGGGDGSPTNPYEVLPNH